MVDKISVTIAGVSVIIAVISLIVVYHQTRKGWHISVLAPQRLEWAENVRNAVAAFISAFYNNNDLRSCRARILLYLNPQNKIHSSLIAAVNAICDGKDFEIDKLIVLTQDLLRWNWWVAKSEAGVAYSEEAQRDKKTQERAKRHNFAHYEAE